MSAIRTLVAVVGQRGEEGPTYECMDCGAEFATEHYRCPDCGCYRVDRTEWAIE